ncbi:uncharacterized protein LOC120280074 isoform X1 [Dioscorea cayenensis subsp. rotundata]|uniref:Uncharacterized protein LOC120280074 isoform X1 n=1 Tax=Dioscorea cayennensis subsp. rotundata TaxID=55577 RepID=A0AB40CRP8_DIOCR|nr:uncharacterized protein LOC120280074 isoform X1 [Dioscorea cayenensis subsp. rotundata]
MALPSTFQERLHQMEETKNRRLLLLQFEKELQAKKSYILSQTLAKIRRIEQRCLLLEKQNAELGFQILARKSEIDALDARYHDAVHQFRVLNLEIDELEMREKENDRFYEIKLVEIRDFEDCARKYLMETQQKVQDLRNSIAELKSTLKDSQNNAKFTENVEVTAAEARKVELLDIKDKLDRTLASNYQLRALLQKQLQKMLILQQKESKTQPAMVNQETITPTVQRER